MPDICPPYRHFLRRLRNSGVSLVASSLLLACTVTPQQSSPTISATPISTSELQAVSDSTLIEDERESDPNDDKIDRSNDLADTPMVALLDADLIKPDPEHSTIDSLNNATDLPTSLQDRIQSIAIAALENLKAPYSDTTTFDTAQDDTDNKTGNDDIWDRLRTSYRLQDSEHRRTLAEKKWYSTHQAYLDRTIERARPYLHLIIEEAEQRNIPGELVLLPIVESAFQPFAYSHGRAAGIWQFIPSTGRIFGLKQNWWYDGRRDIAASTTAAFTYLNRLKDSFDGDWLLALAAYNSGQGTVKKAIARNRRHGKSTDFWSLRLPKETRAYVPKLLAISAIINKPEEYGVTLPTIVDEPYLARVEVGTQIDLALAAEIADMSIEELYRLNPAFNRWATDPDGPHQLLLPIEKAANFTTQLAEIPESRRIKWARHKIKNGETLGQIARKYHTTVSLLQEINKLRGHIIRAGKNLIIPVSTKNMNSYSLSAAQRTQSIQNRPKHGYKDSYIVHKGDTLWDIARAYKVSVNKLASWNGIAPRDVLHRGQKLVIWRTSAQKASRAGGVTLASNATTQRINYTVRSGDSLARISQRFKVKISELRRWNTLPKNKYLQPGQRLTLYVDVTRQSENI